MDSQRATSSSRNFFLRLRPWLMVLAVLLFVGSIRVRLLEVPLERDEGEYAYAGQLILQGIPPYELACNMKLPGTYFAYALGMAVFGQTTAGIHLTLLLVNSLTVIFVFLLGRKFFGVLAGLIACAAYALMSISPAVMGMAAHATHFVVLFAVPGTLLLWKHDETDRRRILFFSGLLYGLAFLMKQQGIFFGLFGGAFVIWQAARRKSFSKGVLTFFVFGLGMILPFAATCLYLTLAGVFSRFWFWTFDYAHSYVALLPWQTGFQLLWAHLRWTADLSLGFWALAVAGILLALCGKTIRHRVIFALLFWFFSFFATATGFYFRDHYFILILPAFALFVGLGVSSLQHVLQSKMSSSVATAIPLILFAGVSANNILIQRHLFFRLPPAQVCEAIYGESVFIESPAVARYIREHSSSDARIAIFGSEPQIYFHARRHSATGYIYMYALMETQPYTARMQQELMAEIESNQPDYLVFIAFQSQIYRQSSVNGKIFQWFDAYAGEFYEKVGVVSHRPTGEADYHWGLDAKNYAGPDKPLMVIFKRKPAPEMHAN